MARDRFVHPNVITLPLSDGDWIVVKQRLTAGEHGEMNRRIYHPTETLCPKCEEQYLVHVDQRYAGLAPILAYLVDWSFEQHGERVVIQGLAAEDLERILETVDPEDLAEVRRAVEAHQEHQRVIREEQKKTRAGAPPSSPISASRDAAGGATSGSETSMLMSTTS